MAAAARSEGRAIGNTTHIPSRLVLVRHGQASLGTEDYDRLSSLGMRQARLTGQRLADVLADAQLWTGRHLRHHQTVAALAAGLQAREAAELDEFFTFDLIRAALTRHDELKLPVPDDRVFADPRTHLAELLDWFPVVLEAWQTGQLDDVGHADWDSFRRRTLIHVPEWRESLRSGQDVVVVSSAGVISTLIAELTGRPLPWQRQLAVKMYNASVSELVIDGDGWAHASVNCVSHLDADGLRTLA